MKLLSIATARFIGAISTMELNPRGLLVYPALIEGLIDKYGFLVSPDEDEVFDEQKGINFEDGAWNNIAIDKVTIFSDGIVVNTRSSTSDAEAIFNEALEWASASYGLTYQPQMVSKRRYVSELVFHSEARLDGLNSKLHSFNDQVSDTLMKFTDLNAKFELSGVGFHYDNSDLKISVTQFRIERLENSPYAENKYYSIAPLPTDEHLRLLEEFETILSKP